MQVKLGVTELFWLKSTTCHINGWNILNDDMEVKFKQRHVQSDLNVQYQRLFIIYQDNQKHWRQARGNVLLGLLWSD